MIKKGTHISIPKYLDILLDDELERLKGIFPKKKDSLIKAIYEGFENEKHYAIYVDKILTTEYAAACTYSDYINIGCITEVLQYLEKTIIINNLPKKYINGTSRLYTYNSFNKNKLENYLIKYFSLYPEIRERLLFPKLFGYFQRLLDDWNTYYTSWNATYEECVKGETGRLLDFAYYYEEPNELKEYINFLKFLFANGLENNLFGKKWNKYILKMSNEGHLIDFFDKDFHNLTLIKIFKSDDHTKFYTIVPKTREPKILNVKEICEYNIDENITEKNNYDVYVEDDDLVLKLNNGLYTTNGMYYTINDRVNAEINIAKDIIKKHRIKGNYLEFTHEDNDRVIECIRYFKDYLKLDCKANNKYIVYGNEKDINNFIKLLE